MRIKRGLSVITSSHQLFNDVLTSKEITSDKAVEELFSLIAFFILLGEGWIRIKVTGRATGAQEQPE